MARVELDQVRKVYDNGYEAVHDVTLTIPDGEFVVLVGPSGCGKSTTLRMIAGLESISSGTLKIGDRVVNDVPPKDRDIAMVFQNYALYPHMTVFDNMAFGLKLRKFPKDEIRERVEKAADILGLSAVLDRKPKALSGGQRQRVSIGRAIVRGPEVFLFDEPLSNLDAELRVEMRVEIARLHKEIGATMIYVTHDQVEAMTLADKIVVLRSGRIEQAGRPMDLYRDPDNRFVAGFIGSPAMNFLAGKAVAGGIEVPGLAATLAKPLAPAHQGHAVTVGLRPEHLALGPGDTHRVDLVESLGGVSYAYLIAPSGERIVVEERGETRSDEGTRVGLIVDPARAYVFDAKTEMRIR